jgi:hypothetical protein
MTDDDAKRHLSDEQRKMWDLAAKATPGKWLWADNGYLGTGVGQWNLFAENPIATMDDISAPDPPDRDFIAAAHPAAVLALLRELARKTAALGSLTDAIENMRVPRTIADAGLQVLVTIGPVVERARAALAPPPTEGKPE